MQAVAKQSNQLAKIVSESGLEKTKAQVLLDKFSNYFEIASEWERKADSLIITSEDQTAEMKMAREGRLFLKDKRVEVEKTRKQLKEASLREGQTIDSIAKILTNLIEPIEKNLEQKEKYAEIQEAKRIYELKSIRESEIESLREFIPFGIDLGTMSEEDYDKLLNGAKLQQQQKVETDRKAEADRIAKQKADEEERERIRLENIRLKEEADTRKKEQEREIKRVEANRIKQEEILRKEREEKQRIASELKRKQDEEDRKKREEVKRIADEEKAKKAEEKRLAKAGDKGRLTKYVDGFVNNNQIDELKLTEEGIAVLNNIKDKFHGFLEWSNAQIANL